jgi:glucose-1-phosphate thymidylyltransferase
MGGLFLERLGEQSRPPSATGSRAFETGRVDAGVIVKGLVLAGGEGTRLRPITHTNAKQLVPVANKPILFYGLEALVKAGVKDIAMIVGETRKEIEQAVGDGSHWGAKITFIPQEAPLGLAHAVKIAQPFLQKEPFVMYLGDNLLRDGIADWVELFRKQKPNAQVLLTQVPHPEQFGVVEMEAGRVVRLVEKPKQPKSNLALVGIYMFDHTVFDSIDRLKPSWRGELEITDAIQSLVDRGLRVEAHVIDGWWKDTGHLSDLLEANRLILETMEISNQGSILGQCKIEGRVVIEKGAVIQDSILRGPVIIGQNTKVTHSYVGPFSSVYHDVVIENSAVEHSIILENSRIVNVPRLADSLIGQNAEVVRSLEKPSAYRVMVGDSSRVEIP